MVPANIITAVMLFLSFIPSAMTDVTIYFKMNDKYLIKVNCADHEYQEVIRLSEKIGNTTLGWWPAADNDILSFDNMTEFEEAVNTGFLGWGPTASAPFQNMDQSLTDPADEPAIASLPQICLDHYWTGACARYQCKNIHLSTEQAEQVESLNNFNTPTGHQTIICIPYTNNECIKDNCAYLHINFRTRRLWLPFDQ